MGWSRHHATGLIHYERNHCYRGYTVIATNGPYAYLIDIEGRVCHRWNSSEGISYGKLLANGNLLFRSSPPKDVDVGSIGGSSAMLQELDWDSNVVWEFRNPMVHHDFQRLNNGNNLVLLWEPIPAELTAQVKGGYVTDNDPEQMYGDVVQEITPEGKVIYEWRSWEHLSVEDDVICPLEGRREWTHQNSVDVTPEGDLVVSFRQTSYVGIVDRASGDFRWKWGAGEISHQHHPSYLDNGRVLIFDNGVHRRGATYSRIIEVDPETNRIAWEYRGDPPISFYSYNISNADRLPNGNTLICEGGPGRIFEVTPRGQIVWEFINPFQVQRPARTLRNTEAGADNEAPTPWVAEFELSSLVFRAHRYGPDFPGLDGRDLNPDRYANINRLYSS